MDAEDPELLGGAGGQLGRDELDGEMEHRDVVDVRYPRRLRAPADPMVQGEVLSVIDGSAEVDAAGGEDPEFEFGPGAMLDGIAQRWGEGAPDPKRGR